MFDTWAAIVALINKLRVSRSTTGDKPQIISIILLSAALSLQSCVRRERNKADPYSVPLM